MPGSAASPVPTVTRSLGRDLADAFEPRDALAGDGLEPGAELGRAGGDGLGAVARSADLDVEAPLHGEVRVPGLHRRDPVVDGAALERVHGRGTGMVEMAKLQTAVAELELAPI